jgi:F-box protein 18 (helicase)
MTPTAQQQLIININPFLQPLTKVIARAGTGKTSTLKLLMRRLEWVPTLYVAFNKSVAEDANKSFPNWVNCRTMHSLAYREVGIKFKKQLETQPKREQVAKDFRMTETNASFVLQTIENFCNDSVDSFLDEHVPIDVDNGREEILSWAEDVWTAQTTKGYPITHSVYLKLWQLTKPRLPYDLILLDEAQDTNPVTYDIIETNAKAGTPVVLVGDPYQQIYSWRGAHNFLATVNAQTYYLTETFRFGAPIAEVANNILRKAFGETHLIESKVSGGTVSRQRPSSYTYLCRTNAGVFHFLAEGNACTVMNPGGFQAYLNTLPPFLNKDRAKLRLRAQKINDFETLSKLGIVDAYDKTLISTISKIKSMIYRTDPRFLVTTTHKAKGLEWDNVVLGADFKLYDENGNLTKNPEEFNLMYVAATRAKKHLTPSADLELFLWTPVQPKQNTNTEPVCQ